MNNHFLQSARGQKLERRYRALKDELACLGWLTNGSVTPNHPGSWRWTRKVKAKTVTVALSEEQAVLFKEAIASHRKLESTLNQMREISQEILLHSTSKIRKSPRHQKHPKPTLT
jgi:hypothetical protein